MHFWNPKILRMPYGMQYGDTDTLGTITGSIAEAFYGIPAVLVAECRSRLDEGLMTDVLDEFDHALGRDRNVDSDDKNGTPGKVL